MKDNDHCHHDHEEKTIERGDKGQIYRAFECVQGRGANKNGSKGHGHFS